MTLIALGVTLILLAGLAAAALARGAAIGKGEILFRVLFGAGCVAGAIPALTALSGDTVPEVRLAPTTPFGPWVFGLDALSAVFLLAILSVGAACAFYGLTYLAHERGRRAIGAAHLLLAVLVASLALAVVARAALPFLIAWEGMAVAAYLLVVLEHERREVRRAGMRNASMIIAWTPRLPNAVASSS